MNLEGVFQSGLTQSLQDIIARLYYMDGSYVSTLVNADTGAFSLALTDVPYGENPYLLTFSSPSYKATGSRRMVESETRILEERSLFSLVGPLICYIKSAIGCGPDLTLRLTWDGPTSDIDLHVFEPGDDGSHVFFDNKIGKEGFLDKDDTDGFGPEHYILESPQVGVDYAVQTHLFSINEDELPINWTLQAFSVGKSLWKKSGESGRK
eukprot:scaffold2205_cov167-Amphora_coffeaeformis.AAC.6